jgi:hypothetical protein
VRYIPLLLALAVGTLAGTARADSLKSEFHAALLSIEQGAYGDAIDRLELLADRGVVHPDTSYNRAVAYIGRAHSPQKQPGDLGRAAAALAETLTLRPDDAEAEAALETVRSEIARTRVRTGGSPLDARPRLARAIVGLAPEAVWGTIAALGAFVLAWGLALRVLVKRASLAVPAALSIGIGVLLFVLGGSLTAVARHFRKNSALAVVIVPEARLLDASGRPLAVTQAAESSVAPEGAEVYVLERRAGLTRIEWGSHEAWVVAGQVREVAR